MIEILWKVCLLYFGLWLSDQITILHMPRQVSCRDMGAIVTRLDYILYQIRATPISFN